MAQLIKTKPEVKAQAKSNHDVLSETLAQLRAQVRNLQAIVTQQEATDENKISKTVSHDESKP